MTVVDQERPAAEATGEAEPTERGRTSISVRAMNRVTAAVTADALGVSARSVSVTLSDQSGLLAVVVRTPIRVASLESVRHDPGQVSRAGGTLVEQAASAQTAIAQGVSDLTGSRVAHVTVTLTGSDIRDERRVQ